jgi:hypothetical protein
LGRTIDFGSSIKKLYAFAPKTYCFVLENDEYRIKAKGCRMTISNKEKPIQKYWKNY